MISPLPDSATEGSGNPLRFYIERSGTSGNLVVNYQLMGTATAGVDYSGLSGSVTIPDGQPGAIITATPINDSLAEGEETITVRLLPSATYQLGIANTATLAISDDEQGVFGVGFYLPKQETQWLLVEGGYPTADGKQRNTSLRVADIVPSAFTYTLNGDSITNKDGLAFVNPYKTVATAGQLSFWVETLDDTYTKAVRVLITDSANGVLVKATEARYKQGDVRGTDWIDSGTSQSVAAGATNAGYGISGIKAVDAAIPAAVAAEAQTVTFQQTKLRIAETQDPLGNVRDVVLKLSPLPLSFGTASTGSVGAPLSAKVLTGQTFTAAQLGIRNRLDSIAIDGLATAVNTSDLKLKVWAQTGDVGSFAPGALVATSRAVRTSGGGSQVSFDFGGEQLSSGAVYAFSLVGADGATVPFSSTLTSRTDGQIGDGRAFAQQVAGLLETRWSGNSAYNNNDWSATPQYQDVWSESASPVNVGDNYSRRLTGLLKPTVTGNYTFYIASDDSSRLFLSTDATAANKVQIASVATGSWTNPQQWNKFSSQTSAVRTLQAGQTYYLEVQHQEVGGGDHVAVAWQGPGMTEKALISAANLAPISPISAAADVSYTVNLKAADTATPNNTVSVKVGPQSGVYHSAFGGNIDYTFLDPATNKPIDPPTVVFAPGETEKVVRIRVNPDGHTEGLESFTLGLSNIAGAAAQPNASQLRVEITDRTDAAIAAGAQVANRYVRLLAERSTLREDAGSDPKLIVALDRPAGNQPITVTLQASGTATAGADYTYDSTVTFLPGEVSKPVNFALIADSVGEGIETIRFTLSEATGALVVGPSVYEITVMDKDAPQILELIGFSQRTDSAGTVVGQFLATPALSKTITSWEILSGNPRLQGSATPAFAIDSQGRITVANPDALPLSDYQFKLAVRATDNTGASNISSATITVGGRQIVEERWNNRNVYNNNQWDQPADIVNGLSAFDAARNVADSYSRRITGVFTVPTSGSYTFWIAADDAARLTIAPYSNPGSEQQIAGLTNAVSYQDWTGQTSQQSSLQNLVAGQRYILRAYQREDGGGDHLSVAWSGPGFNRRVMAASDFLPAQATAIVNTPRYSDSTPASVSTFSLASSAATNTGLTASVASGSFTRDNTLGLSGSADANAVVKIYDGASYLGQTVAQANGTWALTTPTLADGSHTLRAEILDPFGNIAITSPTTYTIRTQTQVGNLQLLTRAIGSSNVLTTGSPADQILDVTNADQGIVAYGVLSGAPFVEQRWDGSSVYNNNSWDSVTPNYTGSLAMLVTAIDVGNNYSRRITGSITVPTSGQYTFYIASDDNSRLYLSTDSTAANKVQIAGVGGSDWTNPQQWDKYSSQKSAAINLQAGQSYYIEVQHLEGAGGDHAAVGWTGPGITQITPIALPTSLLVSDVINGAKLVDRSLTSATSSAGVSTTYADTSSDGRFVVFGTSSPASFGNAGTGFSDTESRLNGTYSDLIVVDRQTGSMRLATSGSNATTTRSRQSQFVGLTADSQYLIYSTDYAEAIADFSTPGKPQPSAWALVDGGYPTTSGKSKTTSLRVADIDPLKLTIAMAGGSIDNDGVVASVSSPTISRSTGSLSFWVQAYDDVYTKAVRLVLEDTATGIVVKATQAKYTSGNQTNFNWTTSGNGGNVATSLNAGGYGVSLLEVQGANLTDSMKNEGVVASRDLIAYNLATGEQRLLSHSSATDSKQSQASNISNATLSAGGRYVLFSANNATKLGNNGVPFSDSAAGVADLFAADLQTNQIRLLSHTAASGTTSAAVGVNLLGTSADDRLPSSAATTPPPLASAIVLPLPVISSPSTSAMAPFD